MVSGIANSSVSALSAYAKLLDKTAQNIANLNTGDYSPVDTVMETTAGGGVAATTSSGVADTVDLSQEAVALLTAQTGFEASVAVLKTAQKTEKSVIDLIA